MNLPTNRFASPAGRARTTTSNAPAGMPTMPPCARWPINGFGFSFAAGKNADPTTKRPTSWPFAGAAHLSQNILLDGATQMSMPPAPRAERISYGPRRAPALRLIASSPAQAAAAHRRS